MTDGTAPGGQTDALRAIDELNEQVRAAPAEIPPQIALWRAIAALDAWFFINRGTEERPRPYAVAAPEGTMVCLYGSPDQARDAGLREGLFGEDDSMLLVALEVPIAIGWLQSLAAAGVVGATYDHPRIGAWTPIANLAMLLPAASGQGQGEQGQGEPS